MARLSVFKINSAAVEAGEWQSPGDEYDDLMIKTRGFTDTYHDVQATRMRRAAAGYGGDVAKVPQSVRREININCLINHVLLDVRGLADETGKTIEFAGFCNLLRDPDYGQLIVACMTAASMVGRKVAQDKVDASGNSAAPSA